MPSIESALSQTFKDFEVIVVDDGSTDNTPSISERFGARIRYIRQENQGLAGARNTGIRAAKGDFIGLLDADDLWFPGFLEAISQLISEHPGAAVYYCCAQGLNSHNNLLPQFFGGPVIPPELMYQTLLRANFIIPSTVAIHRSVILEEGLFDQTIRSIHGCEDYDLWLRISPKYDFIGTSACLVGYRIHESSMSINANKMQSAMQAVVEKHFGVDDGNYGNWPTERRRAFGGLYRYYSISSIQRQNDHQSSGNYLRKALLVDPSLAFDLDFFYDLAMGTQPAGYRNSSLQLDLEKNANDLENVLKAAKCPPLDDALKSTIHQSFGTAYYALGLLAYHVENRSLSRNYLSKALIYRPELLFDKRLMGNILKSFVNRSTLERLKNQ